MNSPILRLFRISLTSLFFVFLLLFLLRWAGYSTPQAPLDHPLVKKDFLIISSGPNSTESPSQSLRGFQEAYDKSSNILLKIDLQLTKDTHLVLYPHESLEEGTTSRGFIIEKSLKEIQQIQFKNTKDQYLLSFESFLVQFPKALLFINLVDRDPAQYALLKKQLERHNKLNDVVIYSKYPEPLKFMRRENPFWALSVAPTDLIQALVMDSLFIETLARLKGDFVVSPLKFLNSDKTVFTPRLIKEYQRRHLKIILENYSPSDSLPAGMTQIDGVITNKPQLFL